MASRLIGHEWSLNIPAASPLIARSLPLLAHLSPQREKITETTVSIAPITTHDVRHGLKAHAMTHRHRDTPSYTTLTRHKNAETHPSPFLPTLREQPRASYEPVSVGTRRDGCIA